MYLNAVALRETFALHCVTTMVGMMSVVPKNTARIGRTAGSDDRSRSWFTCFQAPPTCTSKNRPEEPGTATSPRISRDRMPPASWSGVRSITARPVGHSSGGSFGAGRRMASASLQAFSLFCGSLGKARRYGFKAQNSPGRRLYQRHNPASMAKDPLPSQRSFHCKTHKKRICRYPFLSECPIAFTTMDALNP